MDFAARLAAADSAALQHLGGAVRYTPSTGPAVDVSGVFDAGFVPTVNQQQPGVVGYGPAVFLRLADLPTDPEDDEPLITIAGVDYRVREPQKDGMGGVVLLLYKAT